MVLLPTVPVRTPMPQAPAPQISMLRAIAENKAGVVQAWAAHGMTSREVETSLIEAAQLGFTTCVAALLPVSLPSHCERALEGAAEHGQAACVQQLVPQVSRVQCFNRALDLAGRRGHLECLQLLLPHANPKARKSKALAMAARHLKWDCVQALLPVSDAQAAWTLLLAKPPTVHVALGLELMADHVSPNAWKAALTWANADTVAGIEQRWNAHQSAIGLEAAVEAAARPVRRRM